jgi:hypothetical protein
VCDFLFLPKSSREFKSVLRHVRIDGLLSLYFMMMEVLTVLKTWYIDKISLSGLARGLYDKSNALGAMNIISMDSTIEFQHSQV